MKNKPKNSLLAFQVNYAFRSCSITNRNAQYNRFTSPVLKSRQDVRDV